MNLAHADSSSSGVALTQGRYNSGLGTFLDILNAQTAPLTANTNRVNTQSVVNQARSAMEHAVGQSLSGI